MTAVLAFKRGNEQKKGTDHNEVVLKTDGVAEGMGTDSTRSPLSYPPPPPAPPLYFPSRHDFRNASFGVYCIDGKGTSFLDDAFSIDPETREVFVHITDVQGLVAPGRYSCRDTASHPC